MHLGFAVRTWLGMGSWESSPDERARINCPPVLVIPAMDASPGEFSGAEDASAQGPSLQLASADPQAANFR